MRITLAAAIASRGRTHQTSIQAVLQVAAQDAVFDQHRTSCGCPLVIHIERVTPAWNCPVIDDRAQLRGHLLSNATAEGRDPFAVKVTLQPVSNGFIAQSKGVDNPVTLAAFLEAGWLSEESTDDAARLQHDYVWIIDPIDGTKELIQGIDEFVVAVAFVVQQQVEVAVTYNPVRRELLHACRGQGAFCNDQPVHVSATSHLPGALVLASRSETGRGEWERFRDLLTVRPMGSLHMGS